MPSVIDVFVESLNLVKDNYVKVLALYAISLAIGLVFVGLIFLAAYGGSAGALFSGISSGIAAILIGLAIVFFIVTILIAPIWNGAYYSLALQGMKKKGKASLGKAFEDSKKAYKKMLVTFVIQTVIVFVILAIVLVPFIILIVFLGATGAAAISTLILWLIIGVAILIAAVISAVLGIVFFEAMPLVMINGTSGMNAIKKSYAICKKHFWSILGLLVLMILLYIVIFVVVEMLSLISLVVPVVGDIVTTVIGAVLGALFAGVSGFLPIVFYKRYVKK